MQIQNTKIKLNVTVCSESQKEIQKFLIFNFLKETRLSAISRFRDFHTERMCVCVCVCVSGGGRFLKFIACLWILSFLKNNIFADGGGGGWVTKLVMFAEAIIVRLLTYILPSSTFMCYFRLCVDLTCFTYEIR